MRHIKQQKGPIKIRAFFFKKINEIEEKIARQRKKERKLKLKKNK